MAVTLLIIEWMFKIILFCVVGIGVLYILSEVNLFFFGNIKADKVFMGFIEMLGGALITAIVLFIVASFVLGVLLLFT